MRSKWLGLTAAAVVVLGCSSSNARWKDESAADELPVTRVQAEKPEHSDDDSGDGASSPLEGLGNLGMMSSLLSSTDEPGPYEEPRESKQLDDDAYNAVVSLDGSIVELEAVSWFGGVSGKELRKIQVELRKLAEDEKVKGLVIRFDGLGISMAGAEELRTTLLAIQAKRDLPVYCHAEAVSNITYFVMTACDKIAMAPTGEVTITGVAASPVHLKGLLDKLGIEAEFLHVGAFKGAAEPLTRKEPSKEMLETLGAILDDAYETLVAGIAEGRKLSPDRVKELIDIAMFDSAEAVKVGLVDEVAVFDTWRDESLKLSSWRVHKLGGDGKTDMGKLMQLIGLQKVRRPSDPHVAVVYAVGSVVDGKGNGTVGARSEIASRTLSAALRTLARDDSVKAVVMRVDSGGGSALASELIWHAVSEVKAKKPVIVSMGGVAASGGYYIGCGATKIYAQNNTLTGSIGVVGGRLVLGGALSKLGIDMYPFGRGKRSTMFDSTTKWSPKDRATIENMMKAVYDVFVKRVAEGRGKTVEEIQEIAQGRVWTGIDAKQRGLVDEIGGLDAALAEARKLGGVGEDAKIEIYPPQPSLIDLLGSLGLGASVRARAPRSVETILAEVRTLLGDAAATVVATTVQQLTTFDESRIQTRLILPLVWN